jgi:hypothetical protein
VNKMTVEIGAAEVTLNGVTYKRPASSRHVHETRGGSRYEGPLEGCPWCKAAETRRNNKRLQKMPGVLKRD